MNTRLRFASVGCLALGLLATTAPLGAAPLWPAVWNPVTVGGGSADYIDSMWVASPLNQFNDAYNVAPPTGPRDIVGGVDEHGNPGNPAGAGVPYASAFWALDGQYIMFRMRVDDDPEKGGEFAWQAMIETDNDGIADWVVQLDLSSDNQVEMVQVLSSTSAANAPQPVPGPNDWLLTLAGTPHTGAGAVDLPPSANPTDYYQFLNATAIDGSHFHDLVGPEGADDYFVDFAFPYLAFLGIAQLQDGDPFRLAFSTSATHTATNDDVPDYLAFSDPVPEPATLALAGVGLAALGWRRRRARKRAA